MLEIKCRKTIDNWYSARTDAVMTNLFSMNNGTSNTNVRETPAISYIMNEGNVLYNDALNTFYLRLNSVGHIVKDHSDSERGNPLPPLNGLLFPISSEESFMYIIPQPK